MCQLIQLIKPGAAIVGLDEERHIWIVLSNPTLDDKIAVVMLSEHGRPKRSDHARCTVIRRGEYQGLYSDLCVVMQRSALKPRGPLHKALEDGRDDLRSMRRVRSAVLCRFQQAVLASEYTTDPVRKAIRQTIERKA